MLGNLLFSINRVMPYFLLIVLGFAFRKSKLMPSAFFKLANRFTFRIALPFQLFLTISEMESIGNEGGFMLYVLAITLLSFLLIWLVTELLFKEKDVVGTLVQGAFRGNFVLLGIPLAGAVSGDGAIHVAAVASAIVIPAYNILAVFILSVRGTNRERQSVSSVVKGIFTNPLILGMLTALPFMLTGVRLPSVMTDTFRFVGQTGTPLGLLSIGGLLDLSDATARIKPALYSSFIKNLLLPASVMTASYALGYRGDELLVLLVLTAAPVAISSYIMASEMGGDEPLASNIMIITTFASAFVLAAGIYILKTFALI